MKKLTPLEAATKAAHATVLISKYFAGEATDTGRFEVDANILMMMRNLYIKDKKTGQSVIFFTVLFDFCEEMLEKFGGREKWGKVIWLLEGGDNNILNEFLYLFPSEVIRELDKARTGTYDYVVEEYIPAAQFQSQATSDAVLLGVIGANDAYNPVYFSGEGNLLTVAPQGSGKSQCHVIPNLLLYPGSTVILDVKGELYDNTAHMRRNFGHVFRFDPENPELSDNYNPLEFVKQSPDIIWSECLKLADWLSVPQEEGYFEDRAKTLIAAIVMYVLLSYDSEDTNMREVCSLIWKGNEALKVLWDDMLSIAENMPNKDLARIVEESANDLKSTMENSAKEFSEIINSAKRSLDIWRDIGVSKITSGESHYEWIPTDLRYQPIRYRKLFDRNRGMNIYLCVPVGKVAAYASVLRVIIGQHIYACINMVKDAMTSQLNEFTKEELEAGPEQPVMFMLDEFPQLGYMKAIEEAFEVGRSARIRMWLFAQNLGQIEAKYKNASGIISACNYQSFMDINDHDTAKYVSIRYGKKKGGEGVLTSSESGEVMPISEIQGPRFKKNFFVLRRNESPLIVEKHYAYEDPYFNGIMNRQNPVDLDTFLEEWNASD